MVIFDLMHAACAPERLRANMIYNDMFEFILETNHMFVCAAKRRSLEQTRSNDTSEWKKHAGFLQKYRPWNVLVNVVIGTFNFFLLFYTLNFSFFFLWTLFSVPLFSYYLSRHSNFLLLTHIHNTNKYSIIITTKSIYSLISFFFFRPLSIPSFKKNSNKRTERWSSSFIYSRLRPKKNYSSSYNA